MADVTLVNEDLYSTLPLLTKFSEREIPMKLAYAVGKVEAELIRAHKVIQKLHNKLLKQYAKVDGDGKRMLEEDGGIVMTDRAAFDAEYQTLMEEETVVSIYQIEYEEFEKAFTVKACSKCGREERSVSSEEMTTLVRLGIVCD